MRMGRLAISRGFAEAESSDEAVHLAIVPAVEPQVEPSGSVTNYSLAAVQERLDALERLTRLCESGALTIDEFLVEKAAILGHPRSNLAGPADGSTAAPISFKPAKRRPPQGRSLLGRLGWFILPIGLMAGIGLTAVTQPDAAAQYWQEGLRLFGR
jgi:hypothetical protein